MNTKFFRSIAEKARKVDWHETATLDGRIVQVKDVDLHGKLDISEAVGGVLGGGDFAPMGASVVFAEEDGKTRTIEGVFWPKDIRPESVTLDGRKKEDGHTSLAGDFDFTEVDLTLRFRWKDAGSDFEHKFIVEGEVKVAKILGGLIG